MSTEIGNNDDRDMDEIGKLIRYAGAREGVSKARFDAAHARVAAHWAGTVDARAKVRQRRRWSVIGLAASVVLAVAAGFMLANRAPAPVAADLAFVNRVVGEVLIDGTPATPGMPLRADAAVATGAAGQLAIELAAGQSFRVDSGTRFIVKAADRFALETGAVYVASVPGNTGESVAIETRFGTAVDVGTRFQVRLLEDRVSIGVRDGLVELSRADGTAVTVSEGVEYSLASTGNEEERAVGEYDAIWGWVDAALPDFELDGATLAEYLAWYARERGLELRWADAESERVAAASELSGSLEGLDAAAGFELVRRIAPFEHSLEGRTLTVRVR